MRKIQKLIFALLTLASATTSMADEVRIIAADFKQSTAGKWSIHVTLQHNDTGWNHYADNWRVVDAEGNILGDRVLFHPHVNEQPFTRSLNNVSIAKEIKTIYIEAHDKVHAWTPKRLTVDLSKAIQGRLQVREK